MREHPRGGQTKIVIAIVIPVVVDIKTPRIKIADINAVAVRINKNCLPSPIVTKRSNKSSFCILFGSK